MLRHFVFVLAAIVPLHCSLDARSEDKTLCKTASEYSKILVTEDDQGMRTLYFDDGSVRQSVVKVGDPDHLELPYARAMIAAMAFAPEPQRLLIVGLGGGTLPSFLHKHYPKTTIDVVDIDPVVVDVAKKYFGFTEDDTLHAYVDDGRRFIENCRKPYDMILLDAFNAENIPRQLATREFLLYVRRALTPQGIVLSNVWSRYSNPLHDSMVRTYQDVFPDLYIMEVRSVGNEIFVALPRMQRINQDELARKASAISTQKKWRYDMGEYIKFGLRRELELSPSSEILTDSQTLKKAG